VASDISLADLDVELLPERQTMTIAFNFNPVVAENMAEAVQVLTAGSLNAAVAAQNINVIG
jgi:hypothetical protein